MNISVKQINRQIHFTHWGGERRDGEEKILWMSIKNDPKIRL